MPKRSRTAKTFVITFTAALAFIVGAIKIWDVPVQQMLSLLAVLILLVGGLALAAFLLVAAVKLLGPRLRK